MQNFSQTQLSNIAIASGFIVYILSKHGVTVTNEQVSFVIFSVWSLGWTGYSYYQRFKKGDLTLAGSRK